MKNGLLAATAGLALACNGGEFGICDGMDGVETSDAESPKRLDVRKDPLAAKFYELENGFHRRILKRCNIPDGFALMNKAVVRDGPTISVEVHTSTQGSLEDTKEISDCLYDLEWAANMLPGNSCNSDYMGARQSEYMGEQYTYLDFRFECDADAISKLDK
ncbi:hypothetical protein HY463_01070 [Candidatus Peregrinibacteria bacterium]|nr:hypothetical protein [Candidatus Peregrinibacteria bacterium]